MSAKPQFAEEGAPVPARRAAMATCAEATRQELERAVAVLAPAAAVADIRAPETGLVMVRGRMGGDGAAFNLGEATVTRSAVRLDGVTGFAYHLGRDAAKARAAAILDALWQAPDRRASVDAALAPIAARLGAARDTRARQTQATRVNFFTMVRGED